MCPSAAMEALAEGLEVVCDLLYQAVGPALQLRRVGLTARSRPCHEREGRLSQRETPSMPLPSQGPPSFHGPMNIRKPRSASEPKRSTYSCGLTTLPRLLLIFCPSGPSMLPWLRRRVMGSSKSTRPRSLITLVKKRGRVNAVWRARCRRCTGRRGHFSPRSGSGPLIVVRRQITVPVPRGVHKGVHGVRLASGRTAATGTLGIVEVRVELQWRFARGHELGFLGEEDGEVFFGDGDDAALVAEDYGDRGPPVTLAADQPVVKPVGDRALADAALLEPGRHLLLAFGARGAVEPTRVDHRALAGVGLSAILAVPIRRC